MNKPKNPADAVSTLASYKKLVWPYVQKSLRDPKYPAAFAIPDKFSKDRKLHRKMLMDYPLRQGKYLRPTLLILTAQAMGAKTSACLNTAAAMQISEDWLLIHDDIEDNSVSRRGKPALHKIYGNELAINAGDALHIAMWKVLADNRKVLSENKAAEVMNEFYTMLFRTTVGQTAEISWTQKNRTSFTDKDWFFIADGKTSYYTIAGPMRLGAILAGANNKQLDLISSFGLNLGRCFQIIDDVLDLTSDFDGLKKQTGNDVYEGKRTVILGHLLKNLKGRDKVRLQSILAKPREAKKASEVAWVISKAKEAGSIDYAKSLAAKMKDKALRIFEKDLGFLAKEPARKRLKVIVDFILQRSH